MKRTILFVFTTLCLVANVAASQFKVMVFSKTDGWHHKSINAGVTAIEKLSKRHFFDMDWEEDASRINDKNLEQYDAVIFLNTTGNILNDEQQAAFERFIKGGKGFIGIHSASDTEYDWPWYTKMVGRTFVIHPTNQTARVSVLDRKFPGTETLPDSFLWTDEWYQFGPELSKDLHYILSVDEKTYEPKADWGRVKGEGMGEFHPISWYQFYDGGRSFYTNLGHMREGWQDALFMKHLYGGIYWAATGKGMLK
ncbi:ThuA domain-containing protein [Neptunicella marina]|uniref:ThuA domain-containing protein n=1 Tax=Neptunicella marina TaxID=2125989 RepID=A0A8J6M742_9ALTE|nr:ThuA domain-containing protein [Neptunicella marina]MBC3767481.1 ThuA domain-containing protein [Neptunicella marina]